MDRGLFLIFPDGTSRGYSTTNGLSHVWVRSLCEDLEGNLWVGTAHGGLNVLHPSRLLVKEPPDHWSDQAVLSVCATPDGAIWAGTEGAGLYRLKDERWTHYGEPEGITNLFVWSLAQDLRGRLWVGTWGGRLLVQFGASFVPAPGLETVNLTTAALYVDRQGELWAGTSEGLLRYDEGRLTRFGTREGLVLPDVRAIGEDKEGTIWFGMMGGGLGRLRNGALKQYRKPDGLADEFVQAIQPDAGALWLGTMSGLSRFDGERFASVGLAQGLPNDVVCAIKDDGQGHFWISSHNGIFRVDKNELNRCADGQTGSVNCMYFGKNDGIPSLECSGGFQPAAGMTPDGRIWLPTRKGLAVVSPQDAKKNSLLPPVIIESLLVDGRQFPLGASGAKVPLVIPPGQGRLEVRYTAICFTAPEQVRFRYRLKGFESDWVEAGSLRVANYGYLPPGQYTFQVAACNNDGLWNEAGASLAMTVQPHLWQTRWLQSISGLTLAAAVAAISMRVARRRMHRKLERVERQRALERERMRIAQDIHDDLGSSLTFISMLSQSARSQLNEPRDLSELLNQIYGTARESIRAMDEIVWAVNPKHDSLDSLATYLTKFAQEFLAPAGIRCRSKMPMQFNDGPLTSEVRHNLFLALREALHNVVKHAQASEVRLSLEFEDSAFQVCVADNGKGFVPNGTPSTPFPGGERLSVGNGLRNMHRRLEEVGGRCELQSVPGQGTKVIFRVEMKRPGSSGAGSLLGNSRIQPSRLTKTDD
jgi:signal transduction histidine kinase/streptogramin lyase